MYSYNDDLIYFINRSGTDTNPYVDITEDIIVDYGKAFLKEVPLESFSVSAKNGTSNMIRVDSTDKIINFSHFYVDYKQGIIHLHSSVNGKKINFKYKGKGVLLYPASRIYFENTDDNKNLYTTLKDFILEGKKAIQNVADIDSAIEKSNVAVKEADRILNEINNLLSTVGQKVIEYDTLVRDVTTRVDSQMEELHEYGREGIDKKIDSIGSEFELVVSEIAEEELIRIANEKIRIDSENERLSAELLRLEKELERLENEQIRVSNEEIRVSNENKRISDIETAMEKSNKAQTDAEKLITDVVNKIVEINERIKVLNVNEEARKTAEASRVTEEGKRSKAETDRANVESIRVTSETYRKNNEVNRATAETNRRKAEEERVANEKTRITNETNRLDDFRIIKNNANTTIKNHDNKIEELNSLLDSTKFISEFNFNTQYQKNNIVSFNGSSYIAKIATKGNTPVGNATDVNWGLLAQRGIDGTGAVSSVNGMLPDLEGNIILDANSLGFASIDNIGKKDGIASLDSEGKIPLGQLPDLTQYETVEASQEKLDSLKVKLKDYSIPKTDLGVPNGVAKLNADGKVIDGNGNEVLGKVLSVNGQIGDVTLVIHEHDNKDILDKFTETEDGNVLFDGKEIASDLDGDLIIQQDTEPEGIEEGRLWLDTSDNTFQGVLEFKYVDSHIDNTDIHVTTNEKANLHGHTNKNVLDKFSESNGNVLYDGKEIIGVSNESSSGEGIIKQETEPEGAEIGTIWLDTSDDTFQGTAFDNLTKLNIGNFTIEYDSTKEVLYFKLNGTSVLSISNSGLNILGTITEGEVK